MIIDAHVHLDRYEDRLQDALQQIEQQNILTVATAMDGPSYAVLKAIAQKSQLVVPTFGVHPRRASRYAERLSELRPLIEDSPAIGEIGLDFHWEKDPSTYPAQLKVLEYFFAAARDQNKFVNLHTKGGEKEILNLLEKHDVRRPVVHWYSGPLDVFRAMVEYGCYFTVGVEVFYSEHIKNLARMVPDPLLLTETDNPGGLKWLAGETGMPKVILQVLAALAELRQSTPQAIEQGVQTNFLRLIAGDSHLRQVHELLSAPTTDRRSLR